MRSGYSSRILLISSVPMPEPVPPPSEWQTWKPGPRSRPSQPSLPRCMHHARDALSQALCCSLAMLRSGRSAPWRQSQDSASLRTTSSTESMSSAPSV